MEILPTPLIEEKTQLFKGVTRNTCLTKLHISFAVPESYLILFTEMIPNRHDHMDTNRKKK